MSKHGERTKPPAMVIEVKSWKFHLQPPESKRLNFVNNLYYWAFFVFEDPVISFLPNFPNRNELNNLNDQAAPLRDITARTELINIELLIK